jgi:hypothetical protein
MEREHEYLIEARLDAIERILLDSRVPRSERAEIVQAVENQIFEMLELQEAELTREGVLRVLGSLDPPEAYCCDEMREQPIRSVGRANRGRLPMESGVQLGQVQTAGQRKTAPLAIAALVLSLLSIPMVIIFPVGGLFALAGAVCGVIAIRQIAASQGRLAGTWMAIFGFVMFALHYIASWALFFMLG